MFMRKPISVTLDADNILWLRAQASGSSGGSLSAALDRLVTSARLEGRTEASAIRSVVGTIDLPDDDPGLTGADGYVRALFDKSARQPKAVKEPAASYATARKARRRRG
jgi:hypothetical protein